MWVSALVAIACGPTTGPAVANTFTVPFDFKKGTIGLAVRVKGQPLYAILDSGVDPSVIDLARAEALGLKVDRQAGGETSGVGDTKSPIAYPTTIDGLAIGGHGFRAIRALTSDMGGLSASYGRELDAVLGYSFIHDKAVLIDYVRRRVVISDRPGEATRSLRSCRTRWVMPLTFLSDDNTPVISAFRFGEAAGPGTLDTGSNGVVTLFPRALDLPGLRGALVEKGEVTHSGFHGEAKSKVYTLNLPLGFGPFELPAGQTVQLGKPAGETDMRVANIGNRVFDAMKLRILLDYPERRVVFFAHCAEG